MIKYVTFDSQDEYGEHIVPIDKITNSLMKTASNSYSPELMRVILSLKKKPGVYYVVINALGSEEVWGANGNGDDFPRKGLSHLSLRTDMSTTNDYGYKTFEYYSKFFKHHVNKPDSPSYGEVIFSYWNATMDRVELIVGIDEIKGKSTIDNLENGVDVAVSMGCKVKYDRCSICNNKAATRKQYCKHAKNYLGKVIDRDLAEKWSRELGKPILPGTKVTVHNDYPKFFDISEVITGADRVCYVLGKAASQGHIYYSADIADAYGMTDEVFDKIAQVKKQGDIDKQVGALGPDDIDGKVAPIKEESMIRKALKEKINKTIESEPEINKEILNNVSSVFPLGSILSSMLSLGIHPKPKEFQRIVLVSIGRKDVADDLEDNKVVFDNHSDAQPMSINPGHPINFIMKTLKDYIPSRSCYPHFLEPRVKIIMVKTAQENALFEDKEMLGAIPGLIALGSLAALYAGLNMKAKGLTPKQIGDAFVKNDLLKSIVGGSVMSILFQKINGSKNDLMNVPITEYEGMLQDTSFSGISKTSGLNVKNALGYGLLASGIALPASYIANSYNQKSLYRTGRPAFPGAGMPPSVAIPAAGVTAIGGSLLLDKSRNFLQKALKVK